METIEDILNRRQPQSNRKTNKYWLISCKIANLTETKPNRWLREVKNHEWAVNRAIDHLMESQNVSKNPIGLFIWLLKKYKAEALTNSGK